MNVIVILTLAVIASIEGAFIPGDTPEVALAKVAHFAEHAKEAARNPVYRTVYSAPSYYVPAEVPDLAATRILVSEPARAATVIGLPAETHIKAGFPYVDYYKSLSDYYAATSDHHVYAPSYISPASRVVLPSTVYYP